VYLCRRQQCGRTKSTLFLWGPVCDYTWCLTGLLVSNIDSLAWSGVRGVAPHHLPCHPGSSRRIYSNDIPRRRRVLVLDVTQAAAEVSRLIREAYDLNLPVEPAVRDGRNALVRWAVLLEEVLP
jgi:hypothetical protein